MKMSKLFKKDTKQFINALHKLTDKRFSFNIVHSFNNGEIGHSLEMYFCDKYILELGGVKLPMSGFEYDVLNKISWIKGKG